MHDAWFFIGIFAFIFLLWIATGGPSHPLAFSVPTLSGTPGTGSGSFISLPRAPFSIGGSGVSLPGSSNGASTAQEPAAPAPGVPFGTPSPYRGLVSLSHYVSGAGSDPAQEEITLSVNSSASTPVDLSGWTLESQVTGNASVIPQGAETPTSGIVNAVADIVLEPGESADIISGRSPIGGSFRENKCIGYFGQFQKFSPMLPLNCPSASSELSSQYGDSYYIRDTSCIDYVSNLSRCEAVLSPPTTLSGACQSFLVKALNYNGCVQAHQNDSDFLGSTWRIYLGRTTPLFRSTREVVELLDKQGRTVDAFSY